MVRRWQAWQVDEMTEDEFAEALIELVANAQRRGLDLDTIVAELRNAADLVADD